MVLLRSRATMQTRSNFPSPVRSTFDRSNPSKIVRETSALGSGSTAMLSSLGEVNVLPNVRHEPHASACRLHAVVRLAPLRDTVQERKDVGERQVRAHESFG